MTRHPTGILATCVVPWDENGRFLAGLFTDEVQWLLPQTPQLYIFGTAGEGYAVDEDRFDEVTETFARTMAEAGGEPMVGVISLSLATVVARIERARGMGVRLFQLSLPSWGTLSEAETRRFFEATCGRFADCRFLHYNLLRSGRLVTGDEYARLAAEHPNLVATKQSNDSMSFLRGLMTAAPMLQHFITERGFAYASQLGECGLLASVSTIDWAFCHEFYQAGRNGDAATLMAMEGRLAEWTRELSEAVGPGHIDGAYDKVLWQLHDERFPLRLLPPYEAASQGFSPQRRRGR